MSALYGASFCRFSGFSMAPRTATETTECAVGSCSSHLCTASRLESKGKPPKKDYIASHFGRSVLILLWQASKNTVRNGGNKAVCFDVASVSSCTFVEAQHLQAIVTRLPSTM
eukprot:1684630-Amphidinium_carterae.1